MASTCAGCYSTAHLSSLRPVPFHNRAFSSLRSQGQRQLNRYNPNGFSFRSKSGSRLPKSPSRLSVFCLREPKAKVVTGKSWDSLILKSDIPVLVEFYASWCGPCQMVHRVIDEIATDYSGRLKCFVLQADEELAVAENYDVKAVPVVFLFKNGVKRESVIGTMPKEFYVAAVERVLSS